MGDNWSTWTSFNIISAVLSVVLIFLILIGKWLLTKTKVSFIKRKLFFRVLLEVFLSLFLDCYVVLSCITARALQSSENSNGSGSTVYVFTFISVLVFYVDCGRKETMVLEAIETLEVFGSAAALAIEMFVNSERVMSTTSNNNRCSSIGIMLQFCGVFLVLVNSSSLSSLLRFVFARWQRDRKKDGHMGRAPNPAEKSSSFMKSLHEEECLKIKQ